MFVYAYMCVQVCVREGGGREGESESDDMKLNKQAVPRYI